MAQHKNNTKLIDFKGIAAGVSLDVYIIAIITYFLLVILFALTEYVRPSNKFNAWDIATAIVPCFDGQADHDNSDFAPQTFHF
jgi:hypothetical protein